MQLTMTILKPQVTVRSAVPGDRQKLASLIHFEVYVHRHLDWRGPLDWIAFPPYLVYEQRNDILAALACPPDPPMVAWIRLFAVVQTISVERAWEALWYEALEELRQLNEPQWVAALALWPWFAELLQDQNFIEDTRVVMLQWEGGSNLPEANPTDLIIRPMNYDDIGEVHRVDEAAFAPIWQNSRPSLELAYRQALIATVAETQGRMVGYQISTPTPVGGHLARLAVLPDFQGLGIGYCLVRNLLSQFRQRGARKVTVNTQKNNPASLSLYKRMGFRLTGEEYPVYLYRID
jgi:[ribosomal protein S18]-alanine N-acetyltransferase